MTTESNKISMFCTPRTETCFYILLISCKKNETKSTLCRHSKSCTDMIVAAVNSKLLRQQDERGNETHFRTDFHTVIITGEISGCATFIIFHKKCED